MLLKTPKEKMAVLLLLVASLAIYNFFSPELLLRLVFILGYTLGLEYLLWRVRGVTPFVPSAGIVTALIIFLLFDNISPFYYSLIPATLAVVQKQFLRLDGRHIFNPAAFGLYIASVAGYPAFWWGVSWGWTPLVLIVLGGAWVSLFTLRLHLIVLPFLLSSLGIYILAAGLANISQVPQAFLVSAFWFFAFIMLPEPITSAHKRVPRIIYAATVAVLPLAFKSIIPLPIPGDLFLLSLLLGNLLGFLLDKYWIANV